MAPPSTQSPTIEVVLARCGERGSEGVRELKAHGVLVHVYQKRPCSSSPSSARTLSQLLALKTHVRMMEHNAGDECAAYLQYINDEYDRLPPAVAFLQYNSERQLIFPSMLQTLNSSVPSLDSMGYLALSKHSFEGSWPAPCEVTAKQATFDRCSRQAWRHLGIESPPATFRFYANGLFAVTRARILQRPRAFYADMLERLSGRKPAWCDGPDTRSMNHSQQALRVGDCHVLEKAWHVLFGENGTLPPPTVYNPMRAPSHAVRVGGRFYSYRMRPCKMISSNDSTTIIRGASD
jgi:hypothetical protein